MSLSHEEALMAEGIQFMAGIDEAGRGTWAGPVVAAAVIMPSSTLAARIVGIADSKTLSPKKRERLAVEIRAVAVAVGIGSASHAEIDAIGIAPANRLAMVRAVEALGIVPEHLLIDAFFLPELSHIPQTPIIRGDATVYSIGAASIIAKVTRDQMMQKFHEEFPAYGFNEHKGYGTAAHRTALERYGLCLIHRRTFHPMKTMI
ncbi:MAG: ribonuclease HII [Candidatus Kerfeldbacteria bacterium]|nr:ribonuclease HII [Candidatus Kerfeldbacteria bacterium]